jgi:hypothetical protein
MVGIRRVLVIDDYRCGRVAQAVLDIVKANNPAYFGDKERPIAKGYPIRHLQTFGDEVLFIRFFIAIGIEQGIDIALAARPYKQGTIWGKAKRAGIFDVLGEERYFETLWEFNAFQGQLGVIAEQFRFWRVNITALQHIYAEKDEYSEHLLHRALFVC